VRQQKARAKRGGERAKRLLETRTLKSKNMMREVRREGGGAADGEWGCSSLRVWGWWMLTMNSHAVEISISGGVVEMVRDSSQVLVVPLFLLFI